MENISKLKEFLIRIGCDEKKVDKANDEKLTLCVSEILKGFTPREEKVFRVEFGLDSQSKDDFIKECGITKDIFKEVLIQAVRRFRHPTRVKRVNACLDENQ